MVGVGVRRELAPLAPEAKRGEEEEGDHAVRQATREAEPVEEGAGEQCHERRGEHPDGHA